MTIAGRGLLLIVVLWLTGCTSLVTAPAIFSVYDLGHANQVPAATQVVPAAIEVRAPSWLSSAAMQYRLDFVAPASRDAYAESRWAGHPAEMLQRHLTALLVGGTAQTGSCRLRIDLDEFVQVFESVDRSHAKVVARAALVASRDDTVLARQVFSTRMPAPAADARGGVQAHRDAAVALARDLAGWLDSLDGVAGQELSIGDRCRHRAV